MSTETVDVRFGSLADIQPRPINVCFILKSGHGLVDFDGRFVPKADIATMS
jgi:hypothetical protein